MVQQLDPELLDGVRVVLRFWLSLKILVNILYILIGELRYANQRLSSPSQSKVTTPHKEQVRTCSSAFRLPMRLSRGF
jgi:hypothetical protein